MSLQLTRGTEAAKDGNWVLWNKRGALDFLEYTPRHTKRHPEGAVRRLRRKISSHQQVRHEYELEE